MSVCEKEKVREIDRQRAIVNARGLTKSGEGGGFLFGLFFWGGGGGGAGRGFHSSPSEFCPACRFSVSSC